jgi:hypothetical protein
MMVGDEDGAQAFEDWLGNSSFSTATVVDSVIQRCHQIRTNRESYPREGVLGAINHLLHVAQHLVLNNSEARRRLLKAGLIRHCIAALEEHSRDLEVVKAENVHRPLFSALENISFIARQTDSPSVLKQLAGGATFVLIFRLLDSIPGGEAFHGDREFLLDLVASVARYFSRPDASLEGIPKRDETKQSVISIPLIGEDLFEMIEAAQERSERIFGPCLNACDNPSVSRDFSFMNLIDGGLTDGSLYPVYSTHIDPITIFKVKKVLPLLFHDVLFPWVPKAGLGRETPHGVSSS